MSAADIKVFCRTCQTKLDMSDLEPFSKVACPECGTLLRVPKRFDRYLLEKACGRGGMSIVYRAIDPQLARRVALKVLVLEDEDDREAITAHFLEEAKLLSRLSHPGIIPVYNCGVWEGEAFLAMQFMEQGSMEFHIKNHSLPELPVLYAALTAVAEGLAYALEQGVIHHDVKPGNILFSGAWEAKLSDFDLANVNLAGGFSKVKGGYASPCYASPERLFFGAEDHRGDIFSLGVTIYELLAGEPPFNSQGEPEELLKERQAGEFSPLSTLPIRCGREVSELVDRMLAASPEDRPRYPEIIRVLRQAAAKTADGIKPEREVASTETLPLLVRLRNKFKS